MPHDDGAQLERTALAWRRTGAAVLLGACVEARVLLGGGSSLVSAGLSCMAAGVATLALVSTSVGYARTVHSHGWGAPRPLTSGLTVGLVCSAASLAAVAAVLALVHHG